MAIEIGGISIALQLVTGIGFRWWGLPVAFVIWLLLWKGTFGLVENGIATLGLVTLVFVVGAFIVHPPLKAMAFGLVPTLPRHDTVHYLFIAVSILGTIISPYRFYFYSSGAVKDTWDARYIGVNRAVAGHGLRLYGGSGRPDRGAEYDQGSLRFALFERKTERTEKRECLAAAAMSGAWVQGPF